MDTMDEIDAGDAIEILHDDGPFVYEERGCDMAKRKFIGKKFARVIASRHPEIAKRLVELCKNTTTLPTQQLL
jgi:hypothetical protein